MNLDFCHFERAQSDIGEDFGRGGTSKPNGRLVFLGQLFTGEVHVIILEDLIETILEHSLKRVADKGRSEAFPDTVGTLFSDKGPQPHPETSVLLRVDLSGRKVRKNKTG